ncbi:HECT-type E3 ubiquitin transferase [Fusarium keratoplasticum]|uniref:HECT-type E3 ubiquitin transferase n=1 Tax=Fusarium keratoplasticum TaxID=1328300 RepID=A0ACC0RGK4_9HYPO|nr:HECT-type E3 ubiquitin transferase [Fusarium keratoplasticum]KAI8684605.1 HECT-type E3 ubiquitin transferase [Fusarium keratoplasticum]
MGKITKPMQPKHKDTLSPWLKSYVETASTTPLPLLPQQLASFPSRWPFGRGDLYHWIPLLNRFDSFLEYFCATYKLNEGPQPREFGCDVLLNEDKESAFSNERQWSMKELTELGFPADGDRQLLEVILRFTRMLLEHCGNRSIYASSAHLNDLLQSTSLTVLIATLEVGSELAQRYQASVKRIGNASRQISTALLANHYNIDLERVQQLAQPFVKTPIISLSDPVSTHTPGSAKGKERQQGSSSKAVTSMHANDLVALASSDDKRWTGWGDVKVSYYPQNPHQEVSGAGDTGRASMPSTPTPLRRSSTMTSQHQTPRSRNHPGEDSSPLGPRTPGIADEPAASGPKTFELPQSVVASTPVYELVSRCPDDLPPASKYEAFHRVRASKALLGSRESRQQLLAVRLLAITNLAYIHTESNFIEKVLRQDVDETRRFQLVYQLAELIHPTAHGNIDVPLWLQAVALALLEAVSNFHARCQDVLSALNANVNHGILLYVIRKAVAGMKDEDDSDKGNQVTEMDEWRNNLFSLTLHLCMATRVGSEMVSAGLMEILVEILDIRSGVAQRNHSMVLAFLDGLIWTYQNAFTAFFNAKGLDAVAQLVVDTVKEAQTLHKSGKGITKGQQSGAVDYEIPYYQQQTLKWLLKFVHHIMSNSYSYSGNTDRLLRNLADKSDLLRSLRDIMEDKKSFGSIVWTNSVTILSDFINNDPTSFAAISESGMIKTYLEAITGRPLPSDALEEQKSGDKEDDGPDSPDSTVSLIVERDPRQHPPAEASIRQLSRESLASGILPSTDAITVVPQVLNSISLNNAGMKMVVASRAFDSFLEIFESPVHVRCMEVDADLANSVGASFDELARHHPPLRRAISNAVIDMVARVRFLGIEKAKTAGWGARMLLVDSDGKTVSVDEEANLMPSGTSADKSTGHGTSGDADVDMADGVPSSDSTSESRGGSGPDSPSHSITPYIFALGSFLSSYMSNSVLKSHFVEDGGLELLLDICESPSLPTSFGDSLACRIFSQVVSQMVEFSAIRGLPSLLQRAQSTINTLQPLSAKTDALPPYFAPFLTPDLKATPDDEGASEVIKNGTKMIKTLLNAQTYIKIISESFQTTRSNALQFYPVNVYDYYLNLVQSIGPLLRGVLAEEAGELNVVPQNWSFRRHASGSDGSSGGNNPEPEADDNTSLPDMLSTTRQFQSKKGPGDVSLGRPTEEEQASPRFQNYETLRLLLHPMIPTTFPLFQTLGKALIPRREREPRDPYLRPRHLEIARALADTVLGQLRSSVATPQPTSKDFHFWIIMLHTITEMLIDHSSNRPHDRSGAQIIMPVLLAFKEEGGMDVLNSMLKVFAQAIRQRTETPPDESSKAKVAAFGLKKILDLYLTLVDDKYLSESSTHFALQPRTGDRSQNTPHLDQQLVVEFRAAILPEITDLWDSNFAEKVPHQTVSRLLDILKIISAAENEAQLTTRDKPPFQLFKYTDARFDWPGRRATIDDLLSKGHSPDLVHEAVYRSLGNPGSAREYCTAHTNGLAGPRNPIPSKDSDTSVLQETPKEPSSTGDGEPSSVAGAPEPDRMSLDEPPELEPPELSGRLLGDSLGEIIDRPQATEDVREAPTAAAETPLQQSGSPATVPAAAAGDHGTESHPVATKEDIDKCRAKLRGSMIDRCLDVIRAHPETAIEVSDLIRTMALRQQPSDTQDDVGPTLTSALSSLALDEEEEKKRNGKCIAAYAHLLALLLQDERFFESNIESLREGIDEYVGFLKMPPSTSGEEMPQWIPYILLVIEILLCHDERPVAVQWKAPKSLDEAVAEPIIQMRTPLIDDEQRAHILESLLEMLPRVGKEETLAVAALRVLVILTRNRRLAKLVGDKKNLQRLFLMAKQLSGSGSERFKQTKLTAHIMTILRHIVEDEETIKQIMRAEIKASFPTLQRTQRGHSDVSNYLRAMAPIALRAPDLFVDVTNEMLRFTRWASSSGESARSQTLVLKENSSEQNTDTADERSQPTEDATTQDIKQSTEPMDKEMTDAPKAHHESKRPVVENPDGVIHFLLCELLNYREVDDKEVPVVDKDQKSEAASGLGSEEKASSSKETPAPDGKDKKPPKPVFKAEEHPIFVYRCFLLNCLAELLQSYNRTKMEFINFKRSAPLTTSTPIKPRSTVLNYLIYDLLCQGNLSGTVDSIASKKKAATSAQTQKVLVALVSKTSEKAIDRGKDKFAYDDEPDLLFARKFVLDTMLKAYERAPLSDEPLETRYSRMQCLAELMNYMVGERDKDQGSGARGSDSAQARSHAQLRRLMYEKGYLDKLTSSIAEINLNYPGVKRAIKYILRVLRVLTETAKELSHSNILPSDSLSDNGDDDIASTSSLSDMDDDREETPDLYRNSALGMLEPRGEDDDSDEDEEDDDEDMYGDEYDDDEMDYGEDDISDEEDNISDEDEELSEMGQIEGLHGEPGVVEVIMDEDDDDDDSEEDDEEDDVESADMEDVEDHVEIVDEDGNPIDDDGNSGWESASHDEDDEDHDDEDLEYDADVHEEHIQIGPGQLLDGMARAIMGDDDAYGPDLMDSLDDHYLDDGHDEDEDEDDEDEMEEDEYLYDDDYPLDDQAQPLPALGWDGISPEEEDRHRHMFMMDNQSRRRFLARVDNRSPFPPGFMVGSNRDAVGDFRSYFSRTHRTGGGQSNSDDGANPLLRRSDQGRDGPQRPTNPHALGLRLPEGIFGPGGRHGIDGPMGFLGELMEFLPIMNRSGSHAFHLQFSGPGIPREARELQVRGSRSEQRRDGVAQEPSQAVSFIIESTMDRYQEEARMIFGLSHATESAKLYNIIAAKLTPAAMELERKLKAEEAENQKREEEERKKREEEQRLAREAKEAEEKAEKEKREAEAREAAERAAERAASEAAAASQGASVEGQGESGAMEGVESTEQTRAERSNAPAQSTSNEPRVVTTIRGEEFDVTELGIDPEYLAALPEEFREEVIAQTLTTRRSQAREEATTGESTEVFQEFLDALPDELRREIAHQELQEQRRRAREDQSRQTTTTGGQTAVPEMDTASILLTFPPELREQVLIDQGEELMAHLTPEMAAQARALSQLNNSHSVITGRTPPGVNTARQPGPPRPQTGNKAQRRTVVQMLDKAGVATLLRLMFIAQQGSIRNYLFSVFADVCENKQTRLEVISTLLQILQDGSTDMGAVERSFGQLSLKARRPKDKESEQRTPQTLKRSLTGLTSSATTQTNSETSPLLIVQQCLDLLVELSTKNPHIPWLFLTEHETVGSTLKRSLSRKGKVKDTKAHKYAINSLLSLLDRDLVMESSVVMTHLADLLNRVTMPLQNLERRRKEAEDELKAASSKPTEESATAETTTDQGSGGNQAPSGNANESSTAQADTAETNAAEEAAKMQERKEAAQKKLRQLQPPVIPAQNLTLAVRIFVARECSSKTFQNTISSIKNLSAIPGAKATFGHELVNQARLLSENIVADLDDLLPYIEKASSGTEIQGVALAKFSPGASEQNKLLRVLTALDHLFDSKKKGDETESDKSQDERHGLVTSLYHNSTFSAMWEKLSACLSAIRQRENMLNVATILLPLIESLMVVCKNTTTNDDPSQNKEMVLSSPPPESRTASLFFSFTEDHRRILNELVRNNPKLMSGTFALLVKNPKVLEFDNKRNYFNRSVHSRSGNQSRPSYPPLQLSVRREQVFHDSFKSLYFKSGDEMKFGKLNIRFHGEEGVDAGGVTREWFQVLSRQMFDPNYVLFIPVSSDRTTFHPNKLSGINDEHLMFFKFIGRIIGKALYEGRVLDCYFSRAVYKRILGKSVSVKDMESFDPDYYKSLCWMLDNDITDIITETFSVEDDEFGVTNVVDLIPNGREIAVTEENKHDYVRLVVEHKLLSSVKEQMAHFLQGFHDIIPAELISIFNEQELELLISGLPDIDIDDWKSNTEYHNYNPSSQQIQWFWRALRSFDKEERAKLLQFVTGTSKVPLNGFKELEGMNGVNRFNIHRDYGNKDRLPSSHTCFNQLDLPEYESYDQLRSQIIKAITAGSEYFGFA